MDGGTLHTLWDEAVPLDAVPRYPRYQLQRAKGGEPQHCIEDEITIGGGRSRIIVGERPAEPGELLLDPSLRYIPDWSANFAYRIKTLERCNNDPEARQWVTAYCKSNILYYINTFGWCFDPRRPKNRRTPFCTWEKQDDVITWLVWLIRYGRSGIGEKSRDVGFSWMCVAVAAWLSTFYEDTESLFMSMRQEDVDDRSMNSLLGKVRFFLSNVPEWMRGGWTEQLQGVDTVMDISFPDTHSKIKGILSRGTAGRSGRATVCFNDEFAFVEDSEHVLSALSELANAKIYLSTPNGTGNAFYRMASDPTSLKKTFHWSDHPLKTPEWARLRRSSPDMTEEIWSQEHEIAYETSVIGRVFPEFISVPSSDVIWPHVQDGAIVEHEDAYPTWTTSDLGISDPCSTLWFQLKPVPPHLIDLLGAERAICFFEEHQARNMTAFDLRYLINSKDYHYREHILDMRTAQQRDSSGRTWQRNMEDDSVEPLFSTYFRQVIDPGPPIRVSGKRSPERETIQQARNVFNHHKYLVVFSRAGCPLAIKDIQNWAFPLDKQTRQPRRNDSPEHKNSHFPKAFLYGIDWIYGGADRREKRPVEWNFRVLPRASNL